MVRPFSSCAAVSSISRSRLATRALSRASGKVSRPLTEASCALMLWMSATFASQLRFAARTWAHEAAILTRASSSFSS